MTSEEKQKAIDALKISAPDIAVKHEEFNDYIQTLNKIMDWLEQESTTKNDLVTLTFSKGTLKYSCKDYVVYKKDWLRSHYGAEIDIMFGDSQYKEPTTKNDLGVDKFDKAINQSDLEEWIIETFPDWCEGNVRLIMNHMDEMPSVTPQEPKWIPVSERLPEPYMFVNATCRSLIDDREDWVVETIYLPIPKEANKHGYSDWGNIPILNWGEAEVIAWVERVIPQPYKADRSEEQIVENT